MTTQTKNQRAIWEVFMNAPAAECLTLFAEAQKILVARNVIKMPRTRKPKAKVDAA